MLCCARTKVNEEIKNKVISLVSTDLDWEYLINMASRHRLRPLLYVNLNAICPKKVPEDVLENLKSYYMANVQKNLMMTGELVKVMKLLEENGINAVTYKGPVLAHSVYGNIGYREFGDIDILIDKSDAINVKNIMISNGYEFYPKIKLNDSIYMTLGSGYPFTNKKNNAIIEIKWKVEGDFFSSPQDPNILFKNFKSIKIDFFQFHTFFGVNQLLILCIHSAKHDWSRLSWICDISELVKNENINWEETLEKAQILGIERILLINLALARDLFGLNIFDDMNNHLNSDNNVALISLKLQKRIFIYQKYSLNIFEKFFSEIKIRENPIYGIKSCFLALTKPGYKEYKDIPLPEFLFPLYYIIRPFLLLKRYGKNSI
jgi:hypothetical protein